MFRLIKGVEAQSMFRANKTWGARGLVNLDAVQSGTPLSGAASVMDVVLAVLPVSLELPLEIFRPETLDACG